MTENIISTLKIMEKLFFQRPYFLHDYYNILNLIKPISKKCVEVVQPRKCRPQAKIHN